MLVVLPSVVYAVAKSNGTPAAVYQTPDWYQDPDGLITDFMPTAHEKQVDLPTTELNLPLGHRVHAAVPLADLNVPSGQFVQGAMPSSAPVVPGGHSR
jgi:hypothetical protein